MRASIEEMDVEMDVDGLVTRGLQWNGELVRWLQLPAGTDFTPLFVGLPGGMCQCPHTGYIIDGSLTVRYADGTEETNRAGDVYSWPGGHTGWTDEGVTFIEISPAAELRPVLEHLAAVMAGEAQR